MSQPKEITILQLYPGDMNIYGDWGNTLVLKQRLKWHGYQPVLLEYNLGDKLPEQIDIIIGGGGQDSGQTKIQHDLLAIGNKLKNLAKNGTPMLAICGLYQLFGHKFITGEGKEIKGIGLLDIETVAGKERLIGNVIADSQEFGEIVGYENHSGQTTLGADVSPLATIRLGAGNNSQDGVEGARYKNVIGSYLHGSLLPKNPQIADYLIEQAVANRYNEKPGTLNAPEGLELATEKARQSAMRRPR